ncbi:MAG TPA: FtsX-like permease family protein [Thioalkalivibrio sp.]|nr:FtsX-like permease family protein [Thioalkalivibrio sp.]
MRGRDFIRLSTSAIVAHRMRSFLTALGIAVGIGAVVLLTSVGEGIHKFVLAEFTQFGTNIIAINPGVTTTHGVSGAVFNTTRPLTLDDADALRRIPQVLGVTSFVQGNAEVEHGKLGRSVTVFGAGAQTPDVLQLRPAIGRFLPDEDPRTARAFAVLGSKLRDELFGTQNPLGENVRIGGERYRVIGVMESKGQMLGFDLDDTVYIPTGRALAMFNREGVMEIDVLYDPEANSAEVAAQIKRILIARHGFEDFTVTTQDDMLETLGGILDILTLAVGALGGISLVVGGVGILTIMIISVNERTGEIGLLRALGASRQQVLSLFIGEAVVLASLGGAAGLILGVGGAWLLGATIPALPTHTPLSYVLMAELLAAVVGLTAGVIPARRAASLDPIEALRSE